MNDDAPNNRQGRPRDENTQRSILAATRSLFAASNLRDLTIEAIAKTAGVSKATIYRWWSTKAELVMEACLEELLPAVDFGKTGGTAAIIADQVMRTVQIFEGPVGRMVAQLLAEAQYDPAVAQRLFQKFAAHQGSSLDVLLDRCGIPAIQRDIVVDQIYGAVFFRLILGHRPLDQAFAQDMGHHVLRLLGGV